MRKLLAVTVMCLALPGLCLAAKWDMPTPYPDKTFHTVNIRAFAKDVNEATQGKVDIQVHSAGSLFKHSEIKTAVRNGMVPIGEFFLPLLANENPVFGLDSMPFLATSYDEAALLWAAQKETVAKLLDKQGLIPLYVVPWPPQCFYSKGEINSADDLKGLKFRAYNPLQHQLASKLGMVPTQVEVPDIPQAFATGRIEAMITSPSTGANSKSWDYVTNYYDVRAWLPKNIVVVNKSAFRKLDKDTRTAILEAAAKAEKRGLELSMAETEEKMAILKAEGMTIHAENIEAIMNAMKEAGKGMLEDWLNAADADGKAVIEKYNKLNK